MSEMGSHSLILVLIIFAIKLYVAFAQATLESFRICTVEQGLSPDLIVPQSTGNISLYAELDHRWNVRPVHTHPLAYFVPRVTSDVQVAVRCARANNIPVIPKSGGHSSELLAFGNAGTIVIAFQNMKKIEVNATEKTAVIQSGALLGEIREKLFNEGGFGISSGIGDDVGIGGIALSGGDGWTTPIYNLTVDNILEMEMVDSNGDLHLVNENVNSDLFWALRGVGSGYIGIVTSFKFKLFNATDLRTTQLRFIYDLENFGPVFLAYQNWLPWTEKEGLLVRTIVAVRGPINETQVILTLMEEISNGQPSNIELFLKKINETFPPPLEIQDESLTFPLYKQLRNDEDDIDFISKNADPAEYVKTKSFFVNRTYTAEEIEKVVQIIHRAKNLNIRVYFFGYSGPYNKIPATDMSYPHRGHLYLVSHRISANADVSVVDARLALDWLNEFDAASKIMDSGASFQSYVDLDLSDTFMERYYGVNAKRLIEIKTKWDPDNYFQNEQSIPIANMAGKSLRMLTNSLLCLCLLNVIWNY